MSILYTDIVLAFFLFLGSMGSVSYMSDHFLELPTMAPFHGHK